MTRRESSIAGIIHRSMDISMPDIIWGPVVVGIIVFRLLAKHVCNFSLLEERVSGQDHNKVKKGRGQVTIASQIPASALPVSNTG
jgi:hypothetical protein